MRRMTWTNYVQEWERKWGMSFHPDKCNVLRVTKSKTPIISYYNIRGQRLEELAVTKYLGVDLANNLSWTPHIDRTVKKANSMLGFLHRNLKITSRDTKAAAYFSLVRPNLEYCVSVWNPYTKPKNVPKIHGKKQYEIPSSKSSRKNC